MSEQQPWHRLFGLSWMDFFRGQPVTVEMEKDLSLKEQLLDLVFFHKQADLITRRLPDGFEELATHNLVSFKSYQEALEGWTLNELVGHYVNYRKQVSPSMKKLLDEEDFRLFAVSARYPQKLASKRTLVEVKQGVYEVSHFTGNIRLIVIGQLPKLEHNAMLHLFSAQKDLVEYGMNHYRVQSGETSTLVYQLFQQYQEDPLMTSDEIMKKFVRETIDQMLRGLPAEKRLEGLSAEKRLEGLSAEKRLEGLSAEQRLAGLSPEKRLVGLSTEELRLLQEELARLLKGNGTSAQPK